jgi:hypothetical protein
MQLMAIDEDALGEFIGQFVSDLGATVAAGNLPRHPGLVLRLTAARRRHFASSDFRVTTGSREPHSRG